VWALAGCEDFTPGCNWDEVRAEPNPKEQFFIPYSQQRGYSHLEHDGRKIIATHAAKNYDRIRQRCPELKSLEQEIQSCIVDPRT